MDAAYGEQKKYLEPLRNLWEGSDGIAWLAVCPREVYIYLFIFIDFFFFYLFFILYKYINSYFFGLI